MAKTRSRARPKPAPKPRPTEPEPPDEPACRACGCTDSNGCAGGCYWVLDDLCSACAVTLHVTADEYRALYFALALVASTRSPGQRIDIRDQDVAVACRMHTRMPKDPMMLPMWQAEP